MSEPAHLSWPRRLAPVVTLLLLAPWMGEFLLGNVSGRDILALPFLVPLYGGGALLIREVARRAGRGWPTILLLGAAYGVIEAGLVDQSLFNMTFEDLNQAGVTHVPGLDFSARSAISFVVGHAVWSITVPILLVELWTPSRRGTPWLGTFGLVATVALYLLGCVIIFRDLVSSEGFQAGVGQRIAAGVAALVLIGAAFLVPGPRADVRRRQAAARRSGEKPDRWPPTPLLLGVGAFAVASVFVIQPNSWLGVAGFVVLLVLAAVLVARWGRKPGWSIGHLFALAAGALFTYAWLGFVLTSQYGPNDPVRWAGNIVFALLAVGIVVVTRRRLRGEAR